MIYLDSAATTKVSAEVLEAMLPYFSDVYGNPGSIHSMGRAAEAAIEAARSQVATPIGAKPEKIIFTGSGSEANTLAIIGLADYLRSIGKTHIITTQVEHHSVLSCMKYLFYKGFRITYLPVNRDGEIDLDLLESSINEKTGLASVMTVNNETGNLYPIQEIGKLCRRHDVLFHTDCVQGYCTADINVENDYIDFLSVSGHKIHAPKGVGFLYAGRRDLLRPIILGGGQEYGLRGGTHNTPYIVGMGRAAEIASEDDTSYGTLTSEIIRRILQEIPDAHVNGKPHSNSKIVNMRFDGVDGETLLLLLDISGVEVSAGAACSAHCAVPSHVLSALGLTNDEAKSSIRLSVSADITNDEISKAARIIINSVKKLRGD